MDSLFLVLEGIDGSGTSTQAELLKDYFLQRGNKAVVSPEPSGGPIGKLIRSALQGEILFLQDSHKFDEQMAYLFAADRYYHLYNDLDGVFKLIKRDRCHVIATRYYFSSLAYNCNNAAEFELVSRLNERFPNPDLVIYLDTPIEVSLSRISDRSVRDIYEREEKLAKVKHNYENIFRNYQGAVLKLDSTQPIPRIHQQIISYLHHLAR